MSENIKTKKSTFYKPLYHRKWCKRRGVGGQKEPNLLNVVCEYSKFPLTQLLGHHAF